MFRRRIYAQGFTIFAMLFGSVYWESDRQKRKEFTGLLDEKKKKEKHEAWIRELEVREEEEQELRRLRDKVQKGQAAERSRLVAEAEEKARKAKEKVAESVRSSLEGRERRGPILSAVRDAWERRR
jgi:hypothetical protein